MERMEDLETSSRGGLKLCLISRYFPPMMGSGAPRMEDLTDTLADLGQETHVVTIVPPRGFPRTEAKRSYSRRGRRVYRVKIPERIPRLLYPVLSTIQLFSQTLRVILRERVDLVLATVPNEDSGLAGWLTAKITGRPFILDVRDDWEMILIEESEGVEGVLSKIIYYLFNYIYRSADRVVCTSETLRRRISARRRSERGVRKITNGIRPERFNRARKRVEETRRRYGIKGETAVFTGTLSRHQSPSQIVYAAKELKSRGSKVSVLAAGGGPLLNSLQRLSEELEEPLRFLGPISREEAAELIAASDIGIITLRDSGPSRSMIPLKFFDYVAGRLPIAASIPPDCEIAQIIREEELGIVVKAEDPIDLASAIDKLAEDRELKGKIEERAKRATTRYDWRDLATSYLELMLDLTQS